MTEEKKELKVGLVMPIAPIDGCSSEHWLEIKSIIVESLSKVSGYTFETKIVSESDSIGLIHKRIVQGLYNSDIVICDVSCKNPNVMFELGMRLAFDKPTIIIKDDKTDFSFDTSGIEHLQYPRDLRFSRIIDFKSSLAKKVVATYEDSVIDPNHSPFLKSFGDFKAVKIDSTEVSASTMVLDILGEMQTDIAQLKRQSRNNSEATSRRTTLQAPLREVQKELITRAVHEFFDNPINNGNTNTDAILDYVDDYFKLKTNVEFDIKEFKYEVIEIAAKKWREYTMHN